MTLNFIKFKIEIILFHCQNRDHKDNYKKQYNNCYYFFKIHYEYILIDLKLINF